MSSDYDIVMGLDETLELDTIVEKSNKASDPISSFKYTDDGSEYKDQISGIKTCTAVIDPPKSGEYEITINGQTLSINVLGENAIPSISEYPSSIKHRWHLSDLNSSVNDDVGGATGQVTDLNEISGDYTGGSAADNSGSGYISTNKEDYSSSLLDGAFAVAFTIDLLPSSGQNGNYVTGVGGNSTEGWQVYISGNGGLSWYVTDSNTNTGKFITDNSSLLNDSSKHRVVIQKSSNGNVTSETDLFVDQSSKSGSSNWSDNNATSFNGLGGDPYYLSQSGGSSSIDATIDEIILYDSALTSSEIQTDYSVQPWS